jgi:hypothetical protein
VLRLAAAIVVLVALLAPVFAAAMVPDPTWVAGLYDGADADEILLLIWDGTPAVVAAPPALLEPGATVPDPPPAVARATARVARAAASGAPPSR